MVFVGKLHILKILFLQIIGRKIFCDKHFLEIIKKGFDGIAVFSRSLEIPTSFEIVHDFEFKIFQMF